MGKIRTSSPFKRAKKSEEINGESPECAGSTRKPNVARVLVGKLRRQIRKRHKCGISLIIDRSYTRLSALPVDLYWRQLRALPTIFIQPYSACRWSTLHKQLIIQITWFSMYEWPWLTVSRVCLQQMRVNPPRAPHGTWRRSTPVGGDGSPWVAIC